MILLLWKKEGRKKFDRGKRGGRRKEKLWYERDIAKTENSVVYNYLVIMYYVWFLILRSDSGRKREENS